MPHKAQGLSNTADPEFLARWEPLRMRLRPSACHLGADGVCWVREPYKALEKGSHRYAVRCLGCGGRIGPGRGKKWRAERAV